LWGNVGRCGSSHSNISQTSTYLSGTQRTAHDAMRAYELGLPQPATAARTAYRRGIADGAWEVAVLKAHGIKPTWDKVMKKLAPEARSTLQRSNCTGMPCDTRPAHAGSRAVCIRSTRCRRCGHVDLKQTSTYLNATVKDIEAQRGSGTSNAGYRTGLHPKRKRNPALSATTIDSR
jgi:hypothetical protein